MTFKTDLKAVKRQILTLVSGVIACLVLAAFPANAGSLNFSGQIVSNNLQPVVVQSRQLAVFGNQASASFKIRNPGTSVMDVRLAVVKWEEGAGIKTRERLQTSVAAKGSRVQLLQFEISKEKYQTTEVCYSVRPANGHWSEIQCEKIDVIRLDV